MRCDEVMKTGVHTVQPEDHAEQAARMMEQMNVGFLPVVDRDGKVVGTVTDRDIAIRVVGRGHPAVTTIHEVMTREVVSCKPADDVHLAERLMARNHKSRIIVLDDDGKLAGVISLSDVAERESDPARAARTMREVSDREARE